MGGKGGWVQKQLASITVCDKPTYRDKDKMLKEFTDKRCHFQKGDLGRPGRRAGA